MKTKKLTPNIIRYTVNEIECFSSFDERITLLDIVRKLEQKGYDTFSDLKKSSSLIRETLIKMGWKFKMEKDNG